MSDIQILYFAQKAFYSSFVFCEVESKSSYGKLLCSIESKNLNFSLNTTFIDLLLSIHTYLLFKLCCISQ